MANHVRQQIREAVAIIITGLATTSNRVFQSRQYALSETDLPCLTVYTDGDRVEYLSIHDNPIQEREIFVRIDGYAKQVADLDDKLDTINKEVEVAMSGLAIADSVEYKGSQIDESVLGNQPIGRVSMVYRIKVCNASNAPDVIL